MRIIYFGTSSFAQPALAALVAAGQSVVAVVTQPDRPAGRGGKTTPPPVKELAEQLRLPVLQPESARDAAFLPVLREFAPELIVVAAYGQFLPDAILALPRCGAVNLHGSLLPRLRGAAPIQRAIMHGDAVSGVCLMWMVRQMDAGDVIDCRDTAIRAEDTTGTLTARLADIAAALLLEWLPALDAGTAPHVPQDPARVTFAPMLRKEEREIDWTRPAAELWRQVRALAPAPGAVTQVHGQPLKVLAARPVPAGAAHPVGTVVSANPKTGLLVATGEGGLELLTVQPAGKRAMPAADFLRGTPLTPGERLGSPDA